MADKLHFELVSPARLLKSADVDMVVVPGTEGDFGVLPLHAPVVSTLRTGIVEVHDGGAAEKLLVVGGFAEVNAEGLTILAEIAKPLSEVDKAAYEAELKDLDEDVQDAKNDDERARAEKARDKIASIIEVLEREAA
ncbi:MAG: F0F1 ATP synthase subunit epsilon [Kordiimonadaceae bacterium]|jgi:F-type H+-transporting ATPase subunit epsilon|nr:F0F1 ATP synthase subunit epsilon [Kordiimonadaceae bacterium]MBT6035442.1 F0F1 ATP synthase subunit epsilon [Kordiimonadaceae bacterium]MBT6330151.1 F0F1 ATP synthase subunit epsilon [Kordiimonadaceae bacterium]MBT7583070.1 F0F1 ATP synthase subunit epsilon [Kordiimonadaceae bacterium]